MERAMAAVLRAVSVRAARGEGEEKVKGERREGRTK